MNHGENELTYVFSGITPCHEHHIEWGAKVSHRSLHHLGLSLEIKAGLPFFLSCMLSSYFHVGFSLEEGPRH